jgi:hypothetical protein
MRFNSVSLVVGRILLSITLLLCLGLGKSVTMAQTEILSKQPPVIKVFDPAKNESNVSTLFFDPQSGDLVARAMLERDPDYRPRLRLHRAEYTYPGTIQSRPQTIAFVFLPLDKYKNAPNFSVAADGVLLHEGEATIDELCCEKVNGHTYTQQQIIIAVPTELFERITRAKKVEFKLASKSDKYSFKLNDYQKKCVSALASTIK